MTKHELRQKDMIISPLIYQGQSPYQIITNHPELDMSVRTLYSYLNDGVLTATIVDHINSTPRESLGGRTPYDIALDNYGIDILKALQLRPIPPDEVNLTPKLIRFNR